MAEELNYDWNFWARPKQLQPPGDWSTWLLKAGRGFGKTRTGVSWVHQRAMEKPGRWCALVARTPADARDYLIEGPGGFLRNCRPDQRPDYEPSKRRLTWPNGSWATVYSDEEPDQLRGFSGDTALLDEFAKFYNPEVCWSNLAFGMREASVDAESIWDASRALKTDRPRRMITTTPRPLDILKKIEKQPGTVTVVGSSYENRANLDPTWFSDIILEYEGTRTGRQELLAEYVEEVVGALFTFSAIERVTCGPAEVEYTTTVVAIDPSGSQSEDKQAPEKRPKNDEIGIVVASLGTDNRVYLREDCSMRGGPEEWGRKAIAAYHSYSADHILAESNFGGDMVSYVIRSVDQNIPVRVVTASKAKHVRAEPVAALYDVTRDGVRHVGRFPDLEDQLTKFTTLGYEGSKSPDRADAWIWAVDDLALASGAHSWLEYYRRLAEQQKAEIADIPEKGPQFGYEMPGAKSNGNGAVNGRVKVRVPLGITSVYTQEGHVVNADYTGVVAVPLETAKALMAQPGYERVS